MLDLVIPGAKTGRNFMREKRFFHQDLGTKDDYFYFPKS